MDGVVLTGEQVEGVDDIEEFSNMDGVEWEGLYVSTHTPESGTVHRLAATYNKPERGGQEQGESDRSKHWASGL